VDWAVQLAAAWSGFHWNGGGRGYGGEFSGEAETRIRRRKEGDLAALGAEDVAGDSEAEAAVIRI